MRKLGERNYLAKDFIADASPHGMMQAIHIQAAGHGSKDPVDEKPGGFKLFLKPQVSLRLSWVM